MKITLSKELVNELISHIRGSNTVLHMAVRNEVLIITIHNLVFYQKAIPFKSEDNEFGAVLFNTSFKIFEDVDVDIFDLGESLLFTDGQGMELTVEKVFFSPTESERLLGMGSVKNGFPFSLSPILTKAMKAVARTEKVVPEIVDSMIIMNNEAILRSSDRLIRMPCVGIDGVYFIKELIELGRLVGSDTIKSFQIIEDLNKMIVFTEFAFIILNYSAFEQEEFNLGVFSKFGTVNNKFINYPKTVGRVLKSKDPISLIINEKEVGYRCDYNLKVSVLSSDFDKLIANRVITTVTASILSLMGEKIEVFQNNELIKLVTAGMEVILAK